MFTPVTLVRVPIHHVLREFVLAGLRPILLLGRLASQPFERVTDGRATRSSELRTILREMTKLQARRVPLHPALAILKGETPDGELRMACSKIELALDLESGAPLPAALAPHPQLFDEVLRELVRAGEIKGDVPDALGRIVHYREKSCETDEKLRGASPYVQIVSAIAPSIEARLERRDLSSRLRSR